uniref:NHS-like protein 1 n=1 Tax=Hucho hucho TaxID=62062 RepID=A0A4W5K9H5_9TELE
MLTDHTSANVEQSQDINDATLTSIMLTDHTSANVEQSQDINDATLTSIMLTDHTSANVEQSQDINDATLTSIMLTDHTSANVEQSQDINDATLTNIMLTNLTSANVEQSQMSNNATLTSIMLTNAMSTNDAQHIAKSTEAKLNGITLTSAQERGEGMDATLTSTVLESVGRIDAMLTEAEERTPKKAGVLRRPLRAVFQSSSPAAENTLQNGEPTPRQETTPCLTNGQPEYSAWAYTPTHSPATPSSPHRKKLPIALKKPKISLIMPPPLLRTHQTDTPPPPPVLIGTPLQPYVPETPPPVLIGTPPQPYVPETPPLLGINLYQPEIQTQTESQPPIQRTTKPQTESQPEPEPAYPFLKFYLSQYCVLELPPSPCPTAPCVPELPPSPCPTAPCVPELPPRPCPTAPCVPELPPRPCPTAPCIPELPPSPCPTAPCVPELPPSPCPTAPCIPELPPSPCPTAPCVPELPPSPCPTAPCVPEPQQETEAETDTEAEREAETGRETEREAETERETETDTDREKEADTETERETEREAAPRQPQSVLVPYTELGRSEPEEIWVMQEERENWQKLGRREEEEGEEEDRRRGAMEEDSNDFESFSLEERRDSLSSPLSTDSLKGALLLPDLFIQEDEGDLGKERMEWEKRKEWGKREERCSLDTDGASSSTGSLTSREDNGEVFDLSSAEKMVTPAPPRTTEDLFAAIHRSKRKVLGRRNSEEERCHVFPLSSSSFSSSPPVTPPGPSPAPLQPLEVLASSKVRGHRLGVSSSSDSFKALLLRKGSRCDPAARMSAAERLRSTAPKHLMATPQSQSSQGQSSQGQRSQGQRSQGQRSQSQRSQSSQSQRSQSLQNQSSQSQSSRSSQSQSSQSHPLSDTHLQLGVESHTHTPQPFAQTHTVQLMTLHLPRPQYTHRHRRRAEWALTEGTLPLSSLSSPTYPSSPSLWGWRPPRSPTPPCSASRRFAARSRLPSSPMTAISEREGEGESLEGDGLAVTIGLARDSCKTFGLVELTDGRAEATKGSLDWQQSRSMETHNVLWVG